MPDRLVLEIEVEDFNVDGVQEAADEFCNGDVFAIVTEEWMRADVVLGIVSLPSEKSLNADFEVHAKNGRIVGARIQREGASVDPAAGLPPDLVRILRDPAVTIARDHEIRLADGRTLFEHLQEWRNAPSNTASGDLGGPE